jgi:heterodisulfide reductase subunit B
MEFIGMPLPYFPGCTLATTARDLDETGRACAAALGFKLAELPDWNCCGATFPLTGENLMALVGPTRVLINARQHGDQVVTLCAVCYNVLKRTHHFLATHPTERERITTFIEEGVATEGRAATEGCPYGLIDLRVRHLLEVLRDDLGWDELQKRVTQPLAGQRVAAYYGCLLLRPADEIGLDDPEEPTILDDLLCALGAEPVDFPYQTECCGSYLRVSQPELAAELSDRILASARKCGAEMLITACPLCQSNLAKRGQLPVVYFTQLLAQALGLVKRET